MRWTAVAAGALVELFAIALGATVPLPLDVRVTAGLALLTVGIAGGYVAGRLAGGTWKTGLRHGLVAGTFGGVVFATVLYYTMTHPGSEVGAYWGLNFAISRIDFPPWLVDRYGRTLAALVAALGGVALALEGAIAGGAAGAARVEPPEPT